MKIMKAKHKLRQQKYASHVLGLQRQNLIGLMAKLACVSLLRSKDV